MAVMGQQMFGVPASDEATVGCARTNESAFAVPEISPVLGGAQQARGVSMVTDRGRKLGTGEVGIGVFQGDRGPRFLLVVNGNVTLAEVVREPRPLGVPMQAGARLGCSLDHGAERGCSVKGARPKRIS